MTPDPMRATAERLAREVVDRAAEKYPDTYDRWREMSSPNQDRFIACVLAGLTHRADLWENATVISSDCHIEPRGRVTLLSDQAVHIIRASGQRPVMRLKGDA